MKDGRLCERFGNEKSTNGEGQSERERGSRSTMENWMNEKNIMNIRKEQHDGKT